MSDSFRRVNFNSLEYIEPNGLGLPVKRRLYELTRDGFSFVAMGFTGKEAARWKEAFIPAFNQMEAQLHPLAAMPPAPETVTLTKDDYIELVQLKASYYQLKAEPRRRPFSDAEKRTMREGAAAGRKHRKILPYSTKEVKRYFFIKTSFFISKLFNSGVKNC